MIFFLSGEGPTDLGACLNPEIVGDHENFVPGPMAHIVDRLVEREHQYSILEMKACRYVSKQLLEKQAKSLRAMKLQLPGKGRPRETLYFYKNARALARIASSETVREADAEVVAILFRDSDEGATWKQKSKSIVDGFDVEGFKRGVPMIPEPTSEAWVLVAMGKKVQSGCTKAQLDAALGEKASRSNLCSLFCPDGVPVVRIDRLSREESFQEFAGHLKSKLSYRD